MKTGRSNKNAGFSLVEMVVVMAILGILTVAVTGTVSLITNRKVNSCMETIASTLDRAKVLTLGKQKNQVEFVLTYDGTSDCYQLLTYQEDTVLECKEIEAEGIQIQVFFDGEATGYALNEITPNGVAGGVSGSPSTGLFIQFNRSSGSFIEQTNQAGGAVKNYCNRIVVSNSKKSMEISCVGVTGKIITD